MVASHGVVALDRASYGGRSDGSVVVPPPPSQVFGDDFVVGGVGDCGGYFGCSLWFYF